jgi:hypothetical protein
METSHEAFQAAADEAIGEELRAASWLVYEHYEYREDGGDVYAYAPSWTVGKGEPEWLRAYERHREELERSYPDDPEFAREIAARRFRVYRDNNVKERYAPLNYPDIFLLFAGLADEGPITREVMKGWVEQYGVLGLQRTAQGRGDPRGGKTESLSNFARHAHDAHFVLRLYEAATKPDGPNVEYLRHVIAPPVLPEDVPTPRVLEGEIDGQKIALINDSELTPRRLQMAAQKMRARTSPKQLKEIALDYVARTVQNHVSTECYPLLYMRKDGSLLQGWGFESLLGAMYVQLMWLITAAGEEVRWCLWCQKVIDFEQPEQPRDPWIPNDRSRGYKTRRDIKFCDNEGKCRSAYNYHNVQKPRKQAEKRQLSYEDK